MKKQYISPVTEINNIELDSSVAGGIITGSNGVSEGWAKEDNDWDLESSDGEGGLGTDIWSDDEE